MSNLKTTVFSYSLVNTNTQDLYQYLQDIDNLIDYDNEDNLIVFKDTDSSYNYVIVVNKDNNNIHVPAYGDNKPMANYFWPTSPRSEVNNGGTAFMDITNFNETLSDKSFKKYKYSSYLNDVPGFIDSLETDANDHFDLYLKTGGNLGDIVLPSTGSTSLSQIKNRMEQGDFTFNTQKFVSIKGIGMNKQFAYWKS